MIIIKLRRKKSFFGEIKFIKFVKFFKFIKLGRFIDLRVENLPVTH